jgi:hypothetical protein
MNKSQLKQLIKPVVKECIQEVLIEEGLLTEVVAQVTAGMTRQPIVENEKSKDSLFSEDLQMQRKSREANKKLQEHRKRLLDSIGQDAYNGVDLFEGTEPMKQAGAPGASHRPDVLGDDPNDAGVDISSILGQASKVWQAIK